MLICSNWHKRANRMPNNSLKHRHFNFRTRVHSIYSATYRNFTGFYYVLSSTNITILQWTSTTWRNSVSNFSRYLQNRNHDNNLRSLKNRTQVLGSLWTCFQLFESYAVQLLSWWVQSTLGLIYSHCQYSDISSDRTVVSNALMQWHDDVW